MEFYRRNISFSLWFQKIFTILLISIIIYFFSEGMNDYAFFLFILLIPPINFPITGLILTDKKIILIKYFYGFLPFTNTLYNKNNIDPLPSIIEQEYNGDHNWDSTGTLFDLVGMFVLFLPKKKVRVKYLVLYQKNNSPQKTFVRLLPEEYNLLSNYSV